MKRKILVLTATAMMLAMMMLGSALPALAQQYPTPQCDWYLDYYYAQTFQQNWYGYWCYWPDYGWYLYGWWNDARGYISAF